MSGNQFSLRVAQPADAEGVTAVLASAYPALMARDYAASVLAATLPAMTTANPGLLASGTYHVQVAPGGRIVACGGWTSEEPGTKRIEDGIAHVRHFGTHVDWLRKGLARGIFERCRQEARAAGVHTLHCFSSLGAEPFYAALGFRVRERVDLPMAQGLKFPTVTMVWKDH